MMKLVRVDNLCHLSCDDLDGVTLTPRIPDNFYTLKGYEDNKIKRVCFAERVDKCLSALSRAVEGREFNVYIPESPAWKFWAFRPSAKQVPDVDLTGELWVLRPIKVRLFGRIVVTGYHKISSYVYGDGRIGLVYHWDYEWI